MLTETLWEKLMPVEAWYTAVVGQTGGIDRLKRGLYKTENPVKLGHLVT